MQQETVLVILSLLFLLVSTIIFLGQRHYYSKNRVGASAFLFLGMLSGLLIGTIVFYNLDHTVGWNPFGWWFLATFMLTILGGLLGLFMHSFIAKKKEREKR